MCTPPADPGPVGRRGPHAPAPAGIARVARVARPVGYAAGLVTAVGTLWVYAHVRSMAAVERLDRVTSIGTDATARVAPGRSLGSADRSDEPVASLATDDQRDRG